MGTGQCDNGISWKATKRDQQFTNQTNILSFDSVLRLLYAFKMYLRRDMTYTVLVSDVNPPKPNQTVITTGADTLISFSNKFSQVYGIAENLV